MRKWKQALALVLALVMALSLVALPSFAADEDSTGTGTAVTEGSTNTPGLELRKVYDPSTGLLTLEAYATGSTTTTTSTAPVDIVLVLDVSGSMDENLTEAGYRYNEVYDLSTNGTYYYKNSSNGRYQRAYYCDGEDWRGDSNQDAGWYTQNHQNRGGNCLGKFGTRLIPKTSSADTTGTQFYVQEYVAAVTKMETLKSAVNGFIDSVAEKSPNSSIAVVKFASDKKNDVGNDYNGRGYNYSQIVKNLTTVDATGAGALKTAVSALRAAGATAADYGMQHAQTIITGAANNGRQKVVVMFTDGEPNHNNGFSKSVANVAISASKAMKNNGNGATVYTIGCFGTLTGDIKTKVDKYMNYVSSNYPNATSMTDAGTKASDNFYKTVGSTADLDAIFQEISQTAGGATLTLGSETVLKDVVSKYFDLPENAAANITAKSYSCTELDASGNPIWSETPDDASYKVEVNGKTISVTGFDYSANWVGKDTTTGVMHTPGKKLVVTIPIVDNGTGMGEVPTNGTDSAVYDKDGKQVCPFAQPTAYFPYFTVTHIQSNVDDSGGNYGKNAGSTKHRVPTDGEKFNLTSVVTENYLYGGSFTGEDCTTVQTYSNGENPMAFTPQNKDEYFIWEVPDYYLRPANYYVWRHLPENNGQKTVVRLYPLTSVDRMLYKEVGFQINGTDYVSGTNNQEFDDSVGSAGTAQLYQMVKAVQNGQPYMTMYVNKGKINATAVGTDVSEDKTVNGTPIDEGFIGGLRLPQALFDQFAAGTPVTYRPYWITLDGVKVLGVRDRTSTFEAGSAQPKDSSNKYAAEYSYVSAASTQAMSFAEYFTMDDSQPVVDESLTVTVVDGSNTTQVKVAPNGSVRDQVAYQAPAGKVFAGWFADQAYTIPADLDQVTEDTTIYAKYVSDSYLDLAYSRTGLFRLRGVTLISAVDNPANYQSSGIIVNGDKLNVSYASRYRIFKTPASLFGAARNAKLMLADKSLGGTGTLEVTPYWVTLDGTQVLGQTHTLHYNTRTIWE